MVSKFPNTLPATTTRRRTLIILAYNIYFLHTLMARLLRTPAMHTQRAMPARCSPACGIRAPAVSGWPGGGLVGLLWVCGRLWSRTTASRFVRPPQAGIHYQRVDHFHFCSGKQ